jgi:hypothetical protein
MGMRGHHVKTFKFVTLIQLSTIKHENPNMGWTCYGSYYCDCTHPYSSFFLTIPRT